MMTDLVFKTNYFDEIPNDVKAIIYKYTIPKPPPLPPTTEKYDFDLTELNYMKKLVNYYPTSYVLKKRYDKIMDIFDEYLTLYIYKNKDVPYSKLYAFNKLVKQFNQDHSTNVFKTKYKIEKRFGYPVSQKYYKRR
jgi:hypothetical protein